jgi:hypothetical protein
MNECSLPQSLCAPKTATLHSALASSTRAFDRVLYEPRAKRYFYTSIFNDFGSKVNTRDSKQMFSFNFVEREKLCPSPLFQNGQVYKVLCTRSLVRTT